MMKVVSMQNGFADAMMRCTEGEWYEMVELGVVATDGDPQPSPVHPPDRPPIVKKPVCAPGVLNEAYDYSRPSSFSRALSVEIGGMTMLYISGTASVDEDGATIHVGDFRAQLWRTFRNITELLRAEDMTWHDIVRTTCYLRDIERDYKDFNEVRTAFYDWTGLDPLPASTAIQARICREDLLVEIEAIAMRPSNGK
jgi:2-iminobutanoate/2-iminopropanoate deaminase